MTIFPGSGLGFGDDQENDKGFNLLSLICTRCCFTMTDMTQVCSSFH